MTFCLTLFAPSWLAHWLPSSTWFQRCPTCRASKDLLVFVPSWLAHWSPSFTWFQRCPTCRVSKHLGFFDFLPHFFSVCLFLEFGLAGWSLNWFYYSSSFHTVQTRCIVSLSHLFGRILPGSNCYPAKLPYAGRVFACLLVYFLDILLYFTSFVLVILLGDTSSQGRSMIVLQSLPLSGPTEWSSCSPSQGWVLTWFWLWLQLKIAH